MIAGNIMTLLVKDSEIEIERLTLGPWGTNAYIVRCPSTWHSVLIDAPADADTILAHLEGTYPSYILLTHNHGDHLGALAALHSALKVPLASHALDTSRLPIRPDIVLSDGDRVSFGKVTLEVLHTPGAHAGQPLLYQRLVSYLRGHHLPRRARQDRHAGRFPADSTVNHREDPPPARRYPDISRSRRANDPRKREGRDCHLHHPPPPT